MRLATSRLLLIATLVVAALAAGCGDSRERGATFSFEGAPPGVAFLDGTLAAGGAHAIINVGLPSGVTLMDARSSDPKVVTTMLRPGKAGAAVLVTSGTPGQAFVQLIDQSGRQFDQAPVGVAAVGMLDYPRPWSGAEPLVLAGVSHTVAVAAHAEDGRLLLGTGEIDYALTPPLEAETSSEAGRLQFHGSEGRGYVVAGCDNGGASAKVTTVLPVAIVGPTALASLEATLHDYAPDGVGATVSVDVRVAGAHGPIYGGRCDWTLSSSDVAVALEHQTINALDQAPVTTTRFRIERPGNYLATCALGGIATTVQLSLPQ